jgi:hypothetical protein
MYCTKLKDTGNTTIFKINRTKIRIGQDTMCSAIDSKQIHPAYGSVVPTAQV